MPGQPATETRWSQRLQHSTMRFIGLTFLWAGSLVLADKAILYQWHDSQAIALLAVLINAGLGIATIFAFIRCFNDMDELQRKIQLHALALGMGVGLVGSFSYSLLITSGFVTDYEASDMILLTTVTYMVGVIAGQLRYR